MRILIVAATPFEMAPLLNYLEKEAIKISFFEFKLKTLSIFPLVTGIGSVNTAISMSRFKKFDEMDVILNMGIAGSFNKALNLGTTVEVFKDRFSDLGIEDKDGNFSDQFDMSWEDPNSYPYEDGWMVNRKGNLNIGLTKVKGLTVNTVNGQKQAIDKLTDKYNSDIESMEGAAFMLCCKLNDTKFHQIRSISNYVEERDKSKWEIEMAIDNLNSYIIELINNI
jgi:futalosine hydrolase